LGYLVLTLSKRFVSMRISAAISLAFVVCTPASAINLNFLREAPLKSLSEPELKAFRAFIVETLSNGTDGTTVEWKAPKAVFTSKITPAAKFKDGATECRDATIESDSANRHNRGIYTFCRKGNDWNFKTPSQGAKRGG
jgi:hypothetical protein